MIDRSNFHAYLVECIFTVVSLADISSPDLRHISAIFPQNYSRTQHLITRIPRAILEPYEHVLSAETTKHKHLLAIRQTTWTLPKSTSFTARVTIKSTRPPSPKILSKLRIMTQRSADRAPHRQSPTHRGSFHSTKANSSYNGSGITKPR
jgi:hypothetical protein